MGLGWWLVQHRAAGPRTAKAAARITSLAVKPLDDFSSDRSQAHLSDGMTEALGSALGSISALRVPGRSSVMRFKDTQKSIQEMARELNVDAIVEGSVQRAGDRLRINVRLVEAATDRQLWTASYNCDFSDFLVVQDEVARAIAAEVQVRLTPEDQAHLSRARPVNREALDACLLGMHHWWQFSDEGVALALHYFQQAIKAEPTYAPAHAGLALAYVSAGSWVGYLDARESMPRGKAAAQHALELDPMLSDAFVALGCISLYFEWDWGGAERNFKKAIELSPRSILALDHYSLVLTPRGEIARAVELFTEALKFDPVSATMRGELAYALWVGRQYDQAIIHYDRALELDPKLDGCLRNRGMAHAFRGDMKKAMADIARAMEVHPDSPWNIATKGWLHGYVGDPAGAVEMLRVLDGLAAKRLVPPCVRAGVYVSLKQNKEALDWLEKSCNERDGWLIGIIAEPQFIPLRAEPRFRALIERLGHKTLP